jgi:hypothetical protein
VNHEPSRKDAASPQTWRDRAGRSVLDPNDPRGNPIQTPTDRRWLWRLAREIDTSRNEQMWQLVRDLNSYLTKTCVHHWMSYSGDEYMPAHRQCLWCDLLADPDEPGKQAGTQDHGREGA